MKRKIFICTLAAALAAGGFTQTTASAADQPAAGPARGRLLQRIANKLNLSADQRTQIRSVLAGEKDTLKPLLTAVLDARQNLRSAIQASDANETSVRAASAKVAAAEADLAVERMKLYGKIAPILTEEQRQQLTDLEQRAGRFGAGAISNLGSGLGD